MLPFVAIAPGEAWFSIRAQLTRGVQVESLPGIVAVALGVAADKVGLGTLGVGVAEGGTGDVRSADVTGRSGRSRGSLGGLAAVGGGRRRMDRGVAAAPLPRAGRARLRGGRRRPARPRPGALTAVRALARPARPARGRATRKLAQPSSRARSSLTHAWFPELYRDYVNTRGAPETAYLLGRNALLVALLVVLAAPTARALRSPSRPTAAKRTNAGATGTA